MATDETRARIIAAAGPIFAEKGYRDATVREICDAAGVGLASVNYHFRDKQQLYVRVVEHSYEHVHRPELPQLDTIPEMPARERLVEWIRRITVKVMEEKEITWQDSLFQREIQNPTPACEDVLRERVEADLAALVDSLKQLMPAETPASKLWMTAYSVLGQILFYHTYGKFARLMAQGNYNWGDFSADNVAQHVTKFCEVPLGLCALAAEPQERPQAGEEE